MKNKEIKFFPVFFPNFFLKKPAQKSNLGRRKRFLDLAENIDPLAYIQK